jgi:hypothetical protein
MAAKEKKMAGTTLLYTHGRGHVLVFQVLQREFISRNGMDSFVGLPVPT